MVNVEDCSTEGCNGISIDGLDGRCNACLTPDKEEPDYESAFNIMMEWFDCIPEDEREAVNEELKECGL